MPDYWSSLATYTTTTTTSTGPTITFVNKEDIYKKYADKVDKHVDQLEEDIAFLNDEREKQAELIRQLSEKLDKALMRIDILESETSHIKFDTNILETRITHLEENK